MKEHNLPEKIVRGKSGQSEARAPKTSQAGGRIDTSLKDINWTPAKLRIVMTVLIAPVVTVTIVSFNAGNIFISLVLIGLIIFVGLLYLALRYIDRNEF